MLTVIMKPGLTEIVLDQDLGVCFVGWKESDHKAHDTRALRISYAIKV